MSDVIPSHFQTIILGSGPAGLAAGIYLGRDGKKTLMLGGEKTGGELTTMAELDNYPGLLVEEFGGQQLAQTMFSQVKNSGVEVKPGVIATAVDFSAKPYRIWTQTAPSDSQFGQLTAAAIQRLSPADYQPVAAIIKTQTPDYTTDSVIIATGTRRLTLGLPGEERFIGRGISFCATCDGPFFRDQVIATVGGGNGAIEEALALTKFAREVHFIHFEPTFSRSDKKLQEEALNNPKIIFHWLTKITQLQGEEKLTALTLTHQDGQVSELSVAGLFMAVGTKPNTVIFADQLELGPDQGILTSQVDFTAPDLRGVLTQTSEPGIFAAGDVVSGQFRQVVMATGAGAAAARSAIEFMDKETPDNH